MENIAANLKASYPNNIPALYCRILLLICVLVLPPVTAFAVSLKVSITGVRGELHSNVMARLGLYLHRKNPQLSANDIRILYRQSGEDIRSALAPYGYYDPTITSNLTHKGGDYQAAFAITSASRCGSAISVSR